MECPALARVITRVEAPSHRRTHHETHPVAYRLHQAPAVHRVGALCPQLPLRWDQVQVVCPALVRVIVQVEVPSRRRTHRKVRPVACLPHQALVVHRVGALCLQLPLRWDRAPVESPALVQVITRVEAPSHRRTLRKVRPVACLPHQAPAVHRVGALCPQLPLRWDQAPVAYPALVQVITRVEVLSRHRTRRKVRPVACLPHQALVVHRVGALCLQ